MVMSIRYYAIIKEIPDMVTDAQGIFAPEAGDLALVIVRAKKGTPGIITVTATAKGLAPAKTIIKTN